jgi:hypothetical protein
VRLITRNGHDWTKRFPWIVEAALKNREHQFVVDGEAVVLGVDGVSDFNAVHSRKHSPDVPSPKAVLLLLPQLPLQIDRSICIIGALQHRITFLPWRLLICLLSQMRSELRQPSFERGCLLEPSPAFGQR